MRIGDIRIDPLIDGEVLSATTRCFPDLPEESWAPHRHRLDPETGNVMHTLGGFLLRYDDRVVVVDTGVGPRATYPYGGGGLRSSLYAFGVSPADVTDVLYTHLHMDHIGWSSLDGKPFFPRATYRMDKRDWDYFCSPDYEIPAWELASSDPSRDAATVKLAPIVERVEFFTPDSEVIPGVESVEASGHTPGSTVFRLRSAGEQGMLLGDLVHTEGEIIEDDWDFAMHIDHEAGLESIDRIRRELVDEAIPFAAAHFPGLRWGVLEGTSSGRMYRLVD